MDTRADRLARAVRDHPLVIEDRNGHRCDAGAHTYLADERVLCWTPGSAGTRTVDLRHAVDAEIGRQPVPPALGRRSGISDPATFWRLWTRAEVRAKVRDVPIIVWLNGVDWVRDGDLPGLPPVEVVTRTIGDVVVSLGVGAPSPSA